MRDCVVQSVVPDVSKRPYSFRLRESQRFFETPGTAHRTTHSITLYKTWAFSFVQVDFVVVSTIYDPSTHVSVLLYHKTLYHFLLQKVDTFLSTLN